MIPLPELEAHLKTISKNEWSKLFDLLTEMEKPQEFGTMQESKKLEDGMVSFPCWISSDIVSKYLQIVDELNIIPAFDWGDWQEGKEILRNKNEDYNQLDTITLCKLMTCIIRSDRFSDGALVGSFQDGTMQRIIGALKNKKDVGNMSCYLKVYDNYHYMEESDTYVVKGIATVEEALKRAKGIVQSCLGQNW